MADLKAKYWVGILWCDSMMTDWQLNVDLILQNPYCYIIHDKDINFHGDPKKKHVHVMIAFPNTTTENYVRSIFNEFSLDGMQCCNKVYRVKGIKYMYAYLIHDTKEAIRDKKYLYDASERIEGMGWNTDLFNQEMITDRLSMIVELSDAICDRQLTNYKDLYKLVINEFDLSYFEILTAYSSHFDRMCKGVWLESNNKR